MKKIVIIAILLVMIIAMEAFLIVMLIKYKESNRADTINGDSSTSSEYEKKSQGIDKEETDTIELYIPVDTVLQYPELPHGCEITSLTAILNYYGYNVSKTEMSDTYLPKQPFKRVGDQLYGANPFKAYAGEPRSTEGFFAYAPPIVEAANRYFEDIGEDNRSIDISGSSRQEMMELLDQGIPVVIWVTLDLSQPILSESWHFHDSKEYFLAPSNLHSVVLNGYSGNLVHVMDPLKGHISHDANTFFHSYEALGSQALMIEPNESE
ncbi:C39 family peptidase [Bacillus sp. V3B]|uniref:C39 family peptidase n=1 Tax=Bacillus sp. V3B TaxID=2804915 RepID=UPI00210BDB21|nr:C39 family peptidase [Bacillus sp. V3B]MCQ6276687.1 C39 family peptidase [Bacillus sp. V3B]